jgi:asparagine synthase (glutamine-hydrolysing)
MCGIAGIVKFDGKPIDPTLLDRMNRAIKHRGDDDEGYIFINPSHKISTFCNSDTVQELKEKLLPLEAAKGENYFFAASHRRFSIIDLSTGGHQPFVDESKKYSITFNGEIYNYLEVREELLRSGYQFLTESDTEVFLKAYIEWGTECFNKLNGFWAAAITDSIKKRVVISRDRLGKKPLYYYSSESTFYFASEIKALLEVDEIKKHIKVNENLLYYWVSYGLRDIDNQTFFLGIKSFPAASFTILDGSFNQVFHSFWEVPRLRKTPSAIPIGDAIENINKILLDSVQIRLRADVPLCVELSGGMDSSALVAFASLASKKKISTYTVRFPEKEWNEEPYARKVAEYYDVNYNIIENPVVDFWSTIAPFTYLEEEPYHSPNLNSNQAVWGAMRGEGIKVSLNGAAGDELFAGYGNYFYNVQIENLKNLRFDDFIGNLKWTEYDSALKSFLHPLIYLFEQKTGLTLLKHRGENKFLGERLKKNAETKKYEFLTAEKMLYSELTNTKIPYWLASGDKGYMGLPLEVRAPFLDYRLVEYVATLPVNYLIKDGWHKWIFRKAVEKILPSEVVWRKKKMGFPFPYETFFENNYKIFQLIVDRRDNPFISHLSNEKIIKNWRVISFILWYEYFFNSNMSLFEDIRNLSKSRNIKQKYIPGYLKYYRGS